MTGTRAQGTPDGGGTRPTTLPGPVFVCDASAEAERLITTLRNRGYQTVDVPLGMLPSRVRYEVPSLVVCDADAHEALRRVREMREASSEPVRLLFVGHDDGALRRESGFREIATATLTRPLNPASTLELIERIIGPAPHAPPPRKGQRRVRAPVLVASARKPFRSDSLAPRVTAQAPEPFENAWPIAGAQTLGPLPVESAPDSVNRYSSAPPSSIPPSSGRAELSQETQALLTEGRRRMAAHVLPTTAQLVSRPNTTQLAAIAPEFLEALRSRLDADDAFESARPTAGPPARATSPPPSRSRTPSPEDRQTPPTATTPGAARTALTGAQGKEGSSSGAVGGSPAPASTEEPSSRPPVTESTGDSLERAMLDPFDDEVEAPEPGAQADARRQGSALEDERGDAPSPSTSRGQSQRGGSLGSANDAKLTVPPPRRSMGLSVGAARWTEAPPPEAMERDEPTNPGGRPGSRPQMSDQAPVRPVDPGGDDLAPLSGMGSDAPPTEAPGLDTRGTGRPRRTIESIAARPLFSTPPPLDDLSDLLAPGSSRRPVWSQLSSPAPESLDESDGRAPGARSEAAPASRPSLLPPDVGSASEPWKAHRTIAALGLVVRRRQSGALAQQVEGGVRRVVIKDGDMLNVTSSSELDTLPCFLRERGDLSEKVFAELGAIPRFGRHAGAALIAQGHLKQEDLWPVLRAHAEWILARMMVSQEQVILEDTIPARVSEEPAVFGGAAGAEIYLDVLQRVVEPDAAYIALGSGERIVGHGPSQALLGEAALPPAIERRAMAAVGVDLGKIRRTDPGILVVIFGLVELGVLSVGGGVVENPPPRDVALEAARMDEEAFLARLAARRRLVDDGDYFSILGVARSATGYEIERAKRELLAEFSSENLTREMTHARPDLELVRRVIDEAYLVLKDDVRRARYQKALEAPAR